MNRGQLVEQIAKANNLSKRAADTILSSVIETIQKGVKKDGEV
jgi:nucleoid DNA-binding protein